MKLQDGIWYFSHSFNRYSRYYKIRNINRAYVGVYSTIFFSYSGSKKRRAVDYEKYERTHFLHFIRPRLLRNLDKGYEPITEEQLRDL